MDAIRARLADSIVQPLQQVARERAVRAAEPALGTRVEALKQYQQQRFRRTYADLLANPRYAAAARFFLDELYGSADFTRRDDQFLRIVPALVRLFPEEIVQTVMRLAQLHALTETLDTTMARHLAAAAVDPPAYIAAWHATGGPDQREQQVRLTLTIGEELDRLTRRSMLLATLRMMRGPARAAGLAQLQQFLETGFNTFRDMRGAGEFLACIGTRERALCAALFDPAAAAAAAAAAPPAPLPGTLGQLPWPGRPGA
jgi:hypothetical protein